MVIRHFGKCSTCGFSHTLRISVGHNPYQEHPFNCGECGEDITVGMDVDFEAPSVDIRQITNCELGEEEGQIVNLHPEVTVPEDQIHEDFAFPWMEHTRDILTAQEKQAGGSLAFTSGEKALEFFNGNQTPIDGWAIIKKSWSLINHGRITLGHNPIEKYKDHYFDSPHELNYVLFHFCTKFLSSARYLIFKDAANYLEQIYKNHPREFHEYRKLYISEFHSDHLYRYFEVMSDYFRDYLEFSQTLLFVQNGLPIPEGGKATSSAFRRTKMFYGNTFEALSTNVSVLACLNNIGEGRAHDEFEKMNLKKYLTTNKALRGNHLKK